MEKIFYFSEADSNFYPVPCSKNEGEGHYMYYLYMLYMHIIHVYYHIKSTMFRK